MNSGTVSVIYGPGKGKTAQAIGKGIQYLGEGKTVHMIQFLKGSREGKTLEMLEKLEPEMKVFRFEKHSSKFSELDDEEKREELINIRNGINFGKKVLSTGSCDVLILDEILGLVDRGIMEETELEEMLCSRRSDMSILVTGRVLSNRIRACAQDIICITKE